MITWAGMMRQQLVWRVEHWLFDHHLIPLRLQYRICDMCWEFKPFDPRNLEQQFFRREGK